MNTMSLRSLSLPAHRRRFISIFLPAAAMLALLACGGASDAPVSDSASDATPPAAITSAEFRVRSELRFNTSADLAFEIPGEAGVVNVAVGDFVSAGDVVATLDETTMTNLEQAVSQLELELKAAQDALDAVLGLQSGDDLVQDQAEDALARAESSLAQAQVSLDQAEERLADFQFNHDLSLGRARQAAASTVTALDQAEENLADFADGHSERFANALRARSKAKVDLQNAEDALTDFLPNYSESVTKLRNDISQTEQELDQAREALIDTDAEHADKLSTAKVKLATAEDELRKARAAYTAFSVQAVDETFTSLNEGEVFDVVQLNALIAAVEAGKREVAEWEDEIDELEAGPKEINLAPLRDNISVLEERLARLKRDHADLQGGPDQDEVRLLEATVQSVREGLDRTERDLTEAEAGVDQLELSRLESIVESKRLDLDSAQKQLAKLEEGPDQIVLDSLNTAVDTARQAVDTARTLRDDLAAGPDEINIEQAQFRIDTATLNYSEAQEDLNHAVLRAPFDGVVRVVTIAPGDVIKVDARVIQVVNDRDVSVLGLLETNYIERVKVGTRAAVTLSAVPETTFEAQVASVSDDARTERGVISFPVVFNVTVPDGISIPPHPGLVTTTVLP